MALVTALMATLMMLALGAGMTLTTMTERAIAANHRDGIQTLYAAEAGIDLAISRLRATPDWRAVTTAANGTVFLQGSLADLLQTSAVDARLGITVLVFADPNGDEDVLLLQSSAAVPGGSRRNVEVMIRRGAAGEGSTTRVIETLSWRER